MGPFVALRFAIGVVYPFWRICAKAGYPGWLGVFIVVPIVNVGLVYFLACSEWPALRDGPWPRSGPPCGGGR
jgi:hypothetical protein